MEAFKTISMFGWVGVLVVMFYVGNQPPETFMLHNSKTFHHTEDMLVNPFNKKVSGWSWELKNMPNPYPSGGNCLAVALEIQKRLVNEGRMALIMITDPVENDGSTHAVVLYNSNPNNVLDSVIDNGYVTGNFPRKREGLYTGAFGKYMGEVDMDRCDLKQGNSCYLKPNSTI